MLRALVFWVDDQKTSVVDIGAVPECDRDAGKVTKVVWQDGASYPAQVLKISKCPKTLHNAEENFLKKYNSLSEDSKRQSKQPLNPTVATAIQVARSLGERVELPPQQAAEKSAISKQRRMDNANVKEVESTSDELALKSCNVSHAKRNLMSAGFDSTPVKASGRDAPSQDCEEASPDKTCQTPLKEIDSDACERCKSLTARINPATVEFLLSLNRFCNLAPVSPSLDSSMCAGSSVSLSEGSQLQPLIVESGHKKVELSSGSGLFVKKASKSKAVFSAGGDPEKLTREILCVLYGEKLRQPGISALGNGKKKLGIGETDLQNIYSFVCRNSKVTDRKDKKDGELPDFTFNSFIKVVNKKLKSAGRDRANGSIFELECSYLNSSELLRPRSYCKNFRSIS
ncbi:ATPase synthesis protein 25, mitochondrial [Frankliniella fusca]|uniref:ATPase synthesis protein 25, mitochondrial n=1 Tax=Frankliniella fusca TaxID=407009 RepID=A0AAE1HGC1_9NEOP|nr:ATPase synthesis protein 25, mitochondrial [Frankliniella fusca]